MEYTDYAISLFNEEIRGIEFVRDSLDDTFNQVIELIKNRTGKVIICGIGKSGIIGKKIAATLSSTGTPSYFLHAAEAMHGDLGIVENNDIVILLSYSGNSQEIIDIIAPLKRLGAYIVGVTGNKESILSKESLHYINTYVPKEGNDIEVAPMSSTTATLAIGDAIANALINATKFTTNNFARYHPGGSLGRKLLSKTHDFMEPRIPRVQTNDLFNKIIYVISDQRLGLVLVYEKEVPIGIITDGDIRRCVSEFKDLKSLSASECMHKGFISMYEDEMAVKALHLMHEKKITNIVIKNRNNTIIGILPIHNLTSLS